MTPPPRRPARRSRPTDAISFPSLVTSSPTATSATAIRESSLSVSHGSSHVADLTVGETIDCGTTTVTAEEIVAFAERYDPLGIHTDPDAAAASPFGGLVASGIHTFALTQPPVVEHFYRDSELIAAGHLEEVRLPAPVRPGDTLAVSLEVVDTRMSASNPRRGVVTTHRTATVDDETVFSLRNHTVWER
ncbi:MaoC/PaaZ C-terminal domain-containing protein [Halorarius litoreus]|uniref:MaoC/PaaZ C-terminal domain-containing protein n=1 Tax=Halorarius litoreus TaxID=2962676 RepID=UPI0020CBDA59|nr:MaoC/PaaZ C-terminal domain-containing protein [Halorarius litoreus]